jgi:hypothetical protein
VTDSVVTETTEGITILTTGRKSGKGVLGRVSDGNVQLESVYWDVLLDTGGLGRGAINRVDKAHPPRVKPNVATITMATICFIDIFRWLIIALPSLSKRPLAEAGK